MGFHEELDDDDVWTPAKPKKKNTWWWRDYDYDYRSYNYNTSSGSRSWRSKINGYDYGFGLTGRKKEDGYQDLLNQLQNSANLINADLSCQNIVKWSNGDNQNDIDPKNRIIYLSPDDVIESGASAATDEMIDALTGKVYLASALRETVHPNSLLRSKIGRAVAAASKRSLSPKKKQCLCRSGLIYGECCHPKIARYGASNDILYQRLEAALTLWEGMETSIARLHIMQNWAGFSPYLYKDAERSSVTKSVLQAYVDDAATRPPELSVAVTIIAWNLLNTNDLVLAPPEYKECVELAIAALQNPIPAEDRFDACYELVVEISKVVSKKTPKPPKGSPKPSPTPSPKLFDKSMFGEAVSNTVDVELSHQEAERPMEDSPRLNIPDSLGDLDRSFKLVPLEASSRQQLESYRQIVQSNRPIINALRTRFLLRENLDKMTSYGYRTGDIDENNLHKLMLNDDRLMMRTDVKALKQYAFGLLVDESGSMSGLSIKEAQRAAIILAEALKGVSGVSLSIYGHTANTCETEGVAMREYISPRKNDYASLMQLEGRRNNLDSFATLHMANFMIADYADQQRYLFVISDGQPAAKGYGGKSAMDHMLQVTSTYRKKGVEIYGIGVCNAYSQRDGIAMYGDGRFVILKDVASSVGILGRFITQVLKRR